MTKQEENYVSNSFEPFLKSFEKERVEKVRTPAGNMVEGIL